MPMQRIDEPPVRVSSQPLYDSLRVSSSISAGNNRLFQEGIGSTANGFTAGKTEIDTNISRGGGLPMGQAFRVTSFGILIRQRGLTATSGTAAAAQAAALDCQNIAGNLALTFIEGSLTRVLGTLEMFPAGCGSAGVTVGSGAGVAAEEANWVNVNGLPASGARYRLSSPVLLRDGSTFAWNIYCPTAITLISSSNSYDITVALWGSSFQEVVS